MKAIEKLIRLDIMGFLRTKYLGFPIISWIVAIVVLYNMSPQFRSFYNTRVRPLVPLPASFGGRF